MGKRVNLAELAQEDVPDDYVSASRPTPDTDETAKSPTATEPLVDPVALPVGDIAANPLNRRGDADLAGADFDELVATIREHGVLQPIVVCTAAAFLKRYPDQREHIGRAHWIALIGNRRLLAARTAGMSQVPVVVNDDRVASMYEVMLVENSHRRDLGLLHEAEAMQQVLDSSGVSRRDLATRIGRTHTYVNQRLALLGLIPALREVLGAGELKVELARELGGLPAEQQEAIVADGPPYRQKPGSDANRPPKRRTIAVSTPQKTAESIRRHFSPTELNELLRLLAEALASDAAEG